MLVREDAARHNALAKVLGAALLAGIPTCDKALIFSGRMSGELMEMASSCGAPLFLCHGAATLLAVERAEELGITLAGFVRRGYMNLYTHGSELLPAKIYMSLVLRFKIFSACRSLSATSLSGSRIVTLSPKLNTHSRILL